MENLFIFESKLLSNEHKKYFKNVGESIQSLLSIANNLNLSFDRMTVNGVIDRIKSSVNHMPTIEQGLFVNTYFAPITEYQSKTKVKYTTKERVLSFLNTIVRDLLRLFGLQTENLSISKKYITTLRELKEKNEEFIESLNPEPVLA